MFARGGRLGRGLALAVAVSIWPGLCALAQTFSAPVQLSQHGYANSPMVGIDATGTALAVWADEGSSSSVHAPGTAWTAPQPVLILGGSGLTMRMTPAGFATIASYQSGYGIYTTDRPPGGAWTTPVTAVSGPDIVIPSRTGAPGVIFVGNANGAQAIVWEQYKAGYQVMATRRQAGEAWGAPELVATPPSGLNLALAGATIGPYGDVLVAWETFQTVCAVRYCAENTFIVHASREQAVTPGWSDSGPLTPPINTQGYAVIPLIDTLGHAALVIQPGQLPSQTLAVRQSVAGAKWSKVVTAFADTSGGYPTIGGASTGGRSQGSFALVDYGSPLRILLVDGKLGPDTWSAPTVLSAADASPPTIGLAFGANAADGVAVTWVDNDDTLRAALRKTGTSLFGPSVTVAASDSCQGTTFIAPCRAPGAVAINAAGQAVSLYEEIDPAATVHTLYASTTN